MRLFIAEKPQLAQVIADALGNGRRKGGAIECGSDVVTYCIGHLLELVPPEVHNPAYAHWSAADLPMKLRPAKYRPIEKTKDQLKTIGQLMSQATEIVHAGDPDDEGQLLVEEVLEYFGNSRPVKRILINDLNAAAARKALDNLKDNGEFQGLYRKALARSIGDQIYGFNMTRAVTLAAQANGVKGVLSVGRVQTPILGLIVNRFLAHKGHAGAFYYNVAASMSVGNSSATAKLVPAADAPTDDKNRVIDQAYADQIVSACRQTTAMVSQAKVEEKKTSAPLPFALLDLQVHMSQVHGISSDKTLELTQSLREKHKAITYNRSNCSYLSDEQFAEAPLTLDLLSQALPEMATIFAELDSERKSRAFNTSKVTAHTAIIPTATRVDVSQLSDAERKVYLAIVMRYLAQFLPDKRYLSAEVHFSVAGQSFVSRSTKVSHPGWTVLVSPDAPDDDDETQEGPAEVESPFEVLSALQVGQSATCSSVTVTKEKTKPPALYTEASLLKDLKQVAKYAKDPRIKKLLLDRDQGNANEHGGIGTPATRSTILTLLRERGFYAVEKNKFVPTRLGLDFIKALPAIATTPDMTALWHEQQQMIEAGELTVDQFLDELEAFIADQVSNLDLSSVQGPKLNARCPMCGGELANTVKVIACRACAWKLFPEIASKTLTHEQIEVLLNTAKTPVLKGFKNKEGKAFEASLRLNHDAKPEFVFKKR